MATIPVKIDEKVLHKFRKIKPSYLTMTAFISSMLDFAYQQHTKTLTNDVTYIYTNNKELDKEGLERKEQKEKINKKEKQEKNIPDDLKHLQTLIDDFWKVKKGSKSIQAWKQQIAEYRKFIEKYGEQTLRDQLEAGILAGTWKGLKVSHYEEQLKRIKRFDKEPEKEIKHPAQKVVKFDEMGRII